MTWPCPTDREAAEKWGANCGPAAIAAAFGLDLADVRRAVTGRARSFPGYMGINDIRRACSSLGRPIVSTDSDPGPVESWPEAGVHIGMVQALGPWDRDPREAAKRRHIVAARWPVIRWKTEREYAVWRIYDVNDGRWIPSVLWARRLMPTLARSAWPESTGWRFSWRGTIGP